MDQLRSSGLSSIMVVMLVDTFYFFFSSTASREILNGEFFHIFGKLCFFSYFYHPQKVFKFIVNMKPL